jgi:nucleotide-binding universal stress UspA family protein
MSTILVATDGSERAILAVSAGLAVVQPTDTVVVVTVVDGTDPSLTEDGSGHAGPSMDPKQFDTMRDEKLADGRDAVARTAAALGADVEIRVIEGSPGAALCKLAEDVSAQAIIMGTRGRGGIRRAFLGSVSDYVVRNAPCPVVTARSDEPGGD